MALAASYGVMLSQIDGLIFGNPRKIFRKNLFGRQPYRDQDLHALATEFQHVRFYEDLEDIIKSIFNKENLSEQPRYIIDTGCGEGSLLKNLYDIIITKTVRGKNLIHHPLYVIGVDLNKYAIKKAEITLKNIPHYTLVGDVSNPEKIIADLHKLNISDPESSLHVRAFFTIERTYIFPKNKKKVLEKSLIKYSGSFVDAKGNKIPSAEMIQSLVEHLYRWSNIVSKHGLLVLEVHSMSPSVIAKHFDCESFYFDALQAFSRQYAVAADTFLMSAAETQLFPRMNYSKRYPESLSYSRITLNYFERRGYSLEHANQEHIADLLKIEEECWPEELRVSEEEVRRRIRQFPQGQFVVKLLHDIVGVI